MKQIKLWKPQYQLKSLTVPWNKMVHASFRKVVAFDLLFLGLGIPIGAGITAAFLSGDLQSVLSEVISIAR